MLAIAGRGNGLGQEGGKSPAGPRGHPRVLSTPRGGCRAQTRLGQGRQTQPRGFWALGHCRDMSEHHPSPCQPREQELPLWAAAPPQSRFAGAHHTHCYMKRSSGGQGTGGSPCCYICSPWFPAAVSSLSWDIVSSGLGLKLPHGASSGPQALCSGTDTAWPSALAPQLLLCKGRVASSHPGA